MQSSPPQNLLQRSEDFSNAFWTKTACTITADQIANPLNGAVTADLWSDAASTLHFLSSASITSTDQAVQTFSCYVKAGTKSWVLLAPNAGQDCSVYFNVSTGAIGTVNTSSGILIRYAIEFVGNGWYRCSVTYTHSGAVRGVQMYMANADAGISYTGDGSGTLYIWGAQITGGQVGQYTQTVAAAVDTGPVRSKVQDRQNFALRSEQFDNATWITGNTTVLANQAVNPVDGLTTADLLYPTTTGPNRYVVQGSISNVNPNSPLTVSVYAKASGLNWMALADASGGAYRAWFNLATGVIGTISAGYTAAIVNLGGGWYRCSVTATSGTYGGNLFQLAGTDADNSTTATTSGTNGILIFGAQYVFSTRPGDYTPTTATKVDTGSLRSIV